MRKFHTTNMSSDRQVSMKSSLRWRPLPAIIGATLAVFGADSVFAQGGAAPAQNSPADATQLDVMVVTANKREEDVRKVASAISVIGEEQLDNAHVTQLTDLQASVPGLYLNGIGPAGRTTISLRGVSPLSSGATVGSYLDETPLGSSGIYQAANFFSLDLLPYDIARIEALRGPQGTLYGAGSMGGLLKYVTIEPDTVNREFRFGGGISNVEDSGDLGWNTRFGANLPLVENKLALRVSYARNDIPGFIDNSANGEEDINGGSQTSARAALLWQGDSFKLNLTAMRQTMDSDNNAQVALDPLTMKPIVGDLSNIVNVNEPYSKDVDYYSATLDWDLGWGSFTSATGYSEMETRTRQDTTVQYGQFTNLGLGLPDPGSSYFDIGLGLDKFSQEFRLASDASGPFEWMLGYFYTKEDGNQTQNVRLNQLDGSPLPPPFDSIAGTLATLAIPSTYKENAFFANGSYAFSDVFKLNAGVRYAANDQKFSQNVTEGILLPIGESPNSSSEDVFTWSLSPQFQLSDDMMLYGRVATGYQPGGPNVAVAGLPSKVDSSTLTSYELGMKSQFADRRVTLDVTGFFIDWSDIQVASVVDGISGLVNAGKASSRGVELSSRFKLTDQFELGFNGAYTDSQLDEDYPTIRVVSPENIVEIVSGREGDSLPYVPKWSWAATGDYYLTFNNGWSSHFGGAYRYIGDRRNATTESQSIYDATTTPPNLLVATTTPPLKLDSYWVLDLNASFSNENWTVRGYIKNATDKRGYQSIGDVTNALTGATERLVASPVQPRTIGVEVDYRF